MNVIILYEVVLFVVIQQILTIAGDKPNYPNPCPNNFLRIHNKCYYFSHEHETWERAKWKCQDRNSTLATVSNKSQNNGLRDFLKKGYVANVPRWMAGQYDWKSSQWKWIYNGKVIPQHQFGSDLGHKNMAWHCLVIDPNKNYRWNASSCFDKNYYICQTRLSGRRPQAANLTSNNSTNNSEQTNSNGGFNSTEQRDSQPGYYLIDAEGTTERRKKPRKKFVCPKDYILAGRRCYLLSRDKENWNNAYYKCEDLKAELAIFNNTKQDERLRKKLDRLQIVSEKRWIGGYFDFKNSRWKWAATGRILPIQPHAVTDLKWSCVLWDPRQIDRWSSENCLTSMYYMCQTTAKAVERKPKEKRRLRKPHS